MSKISVDEITDEAGTGAPDFINGATVSGNLSVDGGTIKLDGNYPVGTGNVALGNTAFDAVTSGIQNTAIGANSMTANTSGTNNTALGRSSLASNVSGAELTAVGTNALALNTGSYNTAIGAAALLSNTTASNNTAVGYQASYTNTTGTRNLASGNLALYANTTGNNNVALGSQSLQANTTASDNTSVGYASLNVNTTGANNVALGKFALLNNTTGFRNTAVGYQAGLANTTGNYNTTVGANAGTVLDAGQRNTAFGYGALQTDTKGARAVALGFNALGGQNFTSATDNYNIGIGYDAGGGLTTGVRNTITGGLAGDAITVGSYNCVMGYNAQGVDTKGSRSVAIGYGALGAQNFTSATDNYNVAIGFGAGASLSTGTNNVLIGGNASQIDGDISGETPVTTGNNNVVIGKAAQVSAANADAQVVLGFECTGASNTSLTFGKSTTDSNIDFGATSITAPSDERYKEEITTATAGLSFINDLRPVTYKWKMEKDVPVNSKSYREGSETRVMECGDKVMHGFIAQEVKAVIDNHSEIKDGFRMWADTDNFDNRQRVAPGELIPILVKAMQEQNALIEALTARITTLEG